jgi:Flp pilus assembly protein CpaB
VLIFAVALIGIGLILTLRDFLGPKPEEPRVMVAHAAQQIEPYTPIDQGMIQVEEMRAREAESTGAWRAEQVVGMMATDLVRPGEILHAGNVQSIEEYRGSSDLTMELVSFDASVDRLVAGQIRPGQLINIYGVSREGGADEAYTILVESNVRVVRVFAGAGNPAGPGTPDPNWDTGETSYGEQRSRPTSLLTVELEPQRAYNLIDALSAKRLEPYVTLAGTQSAGIMTTPPAQAGQQAQPTPAIDIGATLTAIFNTLSTPAVQPPATGGGGMGR